MMGPARDRGGHCKAGEGAWIRDRGADEDKAWYVIVAIVTKEVDKPRSATVA